MSGGDAVEVLTGSGAETVLYEFIREEAKQVVVHDPCFWKPLSKSLVSFFASVWVLQSPQSRGKFSALFAVGVCLDPEKSYQERALVNAPW